MYSGRDEHLEFLANFRVKFFITNCPSHLLEVLLRQSDGLVFAVQDGMIKGRWVITPLVIGGIELGFSRKSLVLVKLICPRQQIIAGIYVLRALGWGEPPRVGNRNSADIEASHFEVYEPKLGSIGPGHRT